MRDEIDYREVVEDVLLDKDLKFTKDENGNRTIFALPMTAKNVPVLRVFFDVSESGDCKLRSYLAREVSERKVPAMLKTLNQLNSDYRYITLSIDSDGDVLAAYDFTLFGTDPEALDQNIMTIFLLVCKVMDKCVKPIMKVVWLDDDDDEEED